MASEQTIRCRLPVDRTLGGGRGAFLAIPTAPITSIQPTSVTDDPASNVTLPDGSRASGLTYDVPAGKWLPVRREWVTPDGSKYIYLDAQGSLYAVAATNGSANRLGTEAGMTIVGVDSSSAYLAKQDGSVPAGMTGLVAVPLDGGTSRTIATTGSWYVVGNGWAWGTEVSGGLVSTLLNGSPPPGNVLKQMSLDNGTVETALSRPDAAFRILALDHNGRPLLAAGQDTAGVSLWSIPNTGAVTQLGGGTLIWDAFADASGVWFAEGMSEAIYYARAGGGAQPVAPYSTNGQIRFAGNCI